LRAIGYPKAGKEQRPPSCVRDAPLLRSGQKQNRNPDGSPAGAHPAFKPHPMQGWTPDLIPKLTEDAIDLKVIERIILIPGADGIKWSSELARKEGWGRS
jgi:cysteine synthase A